MSRERVGVLTRRAVLGLFPGLCLGTIGLGCSPAGQASTPRLGKMLERRGTGNPRQKGKSSSNPAPRKAALR